MARGGEVEEVETVATRDKRTCRVAEVFLSDGATGKPSSIQLSLTWQIWPRKISCSVNLGINYIHKVKSG